MAGIEVGEHNDREVVVGITRDDAREALPRAPVFNSLVMILIANEPRKSITRWIGLSIGKRIYGPDAVEARLLKKLRGVERESKVGETQS